MSFRTALRRLDPPADARGPLAVLRRPSALVLQALLLVALVAGTVAFVAAQKTVALAVDGEVTEVSFRGDTVADALAAADLTVGEHDVVAPAQGAELEDGDRVALRRGRPLSLVVDGQERTVWVTALDVDEALEQLDLREEGLTLSASRSRRIPLDGLSLEVRTPKVLTVDVDGGPRPLTSSAATIGEALTQAGIVLGPQDRVTPPITDGLTEGLTVTVDRVAVERTTAEVAVPFGTEKRSDPELAKGTTKELQAGKNGRVRRTVETVVVDGVLESRTVMHDVQLAAPVTRIVAVGTKPVPAAAPRQSTGGADGLNWAALAQCESGGNPRIISPNGLYYGLYQFSLSTWRSVGGSGRPSDASPDEQTYRAKVLYNRAGAGQWPHCGRRLFS